MVAGGKKLGKKVEDMDERKRTLRARWRGNAAAGGGELGITQFGGGPLFSREERPNRIGLGNKASRTLHREGIH